MTFATSIQSLIGDHTWAGGAGSGQCAPNWSTGSSYFYGPASGSGIAYVSIVDLFTGIEGVYIPSSSFTHPTPAFTTDASPICIDSQNNVYTTWVSLNGGGLIQCDGTTLAQTDVGGGLGTPPDGFQLLAGSLCSISVGSTEFILGLGQGGAGFRDVVAYDQVTFAGRYETYGNGNAYGACCAGKIGSGLGFVITGQHVPSDTQEMVIYSMEFTPGGGWVIGDWPTQNANITFDTLVTFVPTDIDGTWTDIYQNGICVDQSDGHLLVWCNGGLGTSAYIVKVNHLTGAIIWTSAIPNQVGGGAYQNRQFQFSSITNNRLCVLTSATGNVVTIINTVDGSSTNYTTGLQGIDNLGYPQCYCDQLGAILLAGTHFNISGAPDHPALLNSTPAAFVGFSLLYVAPIPPRARRFLSESGPIRIIDGIVPIPPIPPIPPVDTAYRVTEEADIRITMDGDVRSLLP